MKKLKKIRDIFLIIFGIFYFWIVYFPPQKVEFWVMEKLSHYFHFMAYPLAKCYYRGRGTQINLTKAKYWFKIAAREQGILRAYFYVGNLYAHAVHIEKEHEKVSGFWDEIPQNYQKAIRWFLAGAHAGDKSSMCRMGYFNALGLGTPRNYKEAFRWYKLTARKGVLPAMCWLGHLYSHFAGEERAYHKVPGFWKDIPLDYDVAIKWYTRAAERGSPEAQFRLGLLFSHGEGTYACESGVFDGIKKDLQKGIEWYLLAASKGSKRAQANLGDMCMQGIDVMLSKRNPNASMPEVERNIAHAVQYYRAAAEKGEPRAQFRLACLYFIGEGVFRNYQKAAEWAAKAAEQGYMDAQRLIGFYYEFGHGVPQDYEQAKFWYTKAAEQGDAVSEFYAARLEYKKGETVDEAVSPVEPVRPLSSSFADVRR